MPSSSKVPNPERAGAEEAVAVSDKGCRFRIRTLEGYGRRRMKIGPGEVTTATPVKTLVACYRRWPMTRNSGVSIVGDSTPYSPGLTPLIESTARPSRSHSKRSSRGV